MSLQVWLPMTKDLRQQGLDNVFMTINSGAIYTVNGKLGGCYSFDATDDWIQGIFDKTKYSGKPITLACWFKSDKVDTGGIIVDLAADLCLGYSYSSNGIQFRFWRCYKNSSNVRTGSSGITSTYYNADAWHHIAIIFDNGIEKIYVDGELSQSFDHTNLYGYWEPLLASSYNRISIGKSAGDSNWIGGLVNDVRIYDHCLSEKEVKELSKGLILHYPLNRQGFGLENLATCHTPQYNLAAGTGNYNYFWVCGNGTLTVGETYTFSAEVEVSGGIDRCTVYNYQSSPSSHGGPINNVFPADGKRHSWTFVADSTGFIVYSGVAGAAANKTATLMNIKIEKGSIATPYIPRSNEALYTTMGLNGTTEYDTSGYCNNGTRTGTFSWMSDTPKYDVSAKFSGSNYILTDSGTFSWFDFDELTLAGWMKPTNSPSSYSGSFGIAHNSIDGYYSKCFSISNSSSKFTINAAKGSTWTWITSSYVVPTNEWHHYVATLKGTEVKMYVDGELIHSATIDWNTAKVASDTRFQVGVDLPGSDETYQGYYSDIRAYATALSADDIKSLYESNKL